MDFLIELLNAVVYLSKSTSLRTTSTLAIALIRWQEIYPSPLMIACIICATPGRNFYA